jgi:hypothetical protein
MKCLHYVTPCSLPSSLSVLLVPSPFGAPLHQGLPRVQNDSSSLDQLQVTPAQPKHHYTVSQYVGHDCSATVSVCILLSLIESS